MNGLELTEDGIKHMVREIEQDMTVQAINLKKVKTTSRIMCELSDGISKIRGYITDARVTETDNNAIILIKSFGLLTPNNASNDKPVGIVVHLCEVLDHYIEQIGKPIDILKAETGEEHNKQNFKPVIVPQKLKSYIDRHSAPPEPAPNNRHNPVQRLYPQRTVSIEQSSNHGSGVNESQKIADLYPDLQNWEIIARLIKKNYREFISKSGKGKLTKVLNLEFMDITGMKITGAMFGDSAVEFYQALHEDTIYRVSKGQVREDQFNQNKGSNFSRHTIMFTRNSLFAKISNSELLPQYEAKLTDLGKISQHRNIGQEYDSVAIILSIMDEVQIPKETRTLYKQVFQICDPVNEFVMEAIIWNRNLPIDDRFLGRTVAMKGFRLNSFNDRLSLNSSYQSEIKILDRHPYREYEGKVERERLEMLSEKKEKNVEIEEPCKNLKELENELVYLEQGKEIKSTMTLMLTLISYKKWSYESCPHCRKSAEANQKCNHCEKYIEDTIPRYKLNVELSDCCGSVWATGFEELGARLFCDIPQGIKFIKDLEEQERHRLFEKKQFQEFTFKLTSKFDRDGNVKHTVNRIYDYNLMGKVQENIKRIKNHLE